MADMDTIDAAVSPFRRHVLRAVYLIIALGMGLQVWPQILTHGGAWNEGWGTVKCMLGALTLLSLLGLRWPLKMLPLLFWEMAWKTIWLLVVALPAWRAGTMDAETSANTFACSLVIVVYAAVPWSYVFRHYAGGANDRRQALPA